jgi:hypothetical protein
MPAPQPICGYRSTAAAYTDIRDAAHTLIATAEAGGADWERLHGEEDALLAQILQLVAAGHPRTKSLAKLGLMVYQHNHPRWAA